MDFQERAAREASVRDLVAVVFRQKWIILTIFAITTVSVSIFNLNTPTTYESSARVQVTRGRMESAAATHRRVLGWEEEMASELENIRSYPVARRAQEVLDRWAEDGEISRPIRMNRGGISARVIGESTVLELAYTSQDASVCRPVTDALTEAYRDFRTESRMIAGVDDFFAKELEQVRSEIEALEAEKTAFLSQSGELTGDSEERSLATLLSQQQFRLMKIEGDLETYAYSYERAKEMQKAGTLDPAFFQEISFENLQTLNQLRDEVIDLRLQRDEKAAGLTPEHPEMKAVEDALASAESMLSREIESTMTLMGQKIAELEDSKANAVATIANLRTQKNTIPENDVRLARLDHQLSLKRDQERDLSRSQVNSKINMAAAPEAAVTILAPAGPPFAKNTKDYVRMALAPLMSLVVGFLVAFFLDSLDHTLRTAGDVEEHLGLPVLASLPESKR